MCGGTAHTHARPSMEKGLSPRVRGNRSASIRGSMVVGSIPACAGEPGLLLPILNLLAVYPRVCGGTFNLRTLTVRRQGLSPRVRGNRGAVRRAAPCHGSIPACAGEPLARTPLCTRPEVYPRVCGGTVPIDGILVWDDGLSPRVRGNQHLHAPAPALRRSIPACAGEPGLSRESRTSCGVYPRVCGGTRGSGTRGWRGRGLSPRVRGNLIDEARKKGSRGSIPACAGEPASPW